MASHTIVAVYDTPAHAELAIADLKQAGIPASSIQHYTRETTSGINTTNPADTQSHEHTGFWAWLTGTETTTEHHALYDRSIANGGTVVTVVAGEHDGDRISAILEQHAPIDMEERASQYGITAADSGTGGAYEAADTKAPASTTLGRAAEDVLSLSEETLQVGKREVAAGITRLRRYVVERPVEEQVRLRDETVKVFRRPVTGTATTGADAFSDKTIEMAHTKEEAVIGKSAHVVEEVVLQKGSQERVETVRDTLRREEVEVTGPNDGKAAPVVREHA